MGVDTTKEIVLDGEGNESTVTVAIRPRQQWIQLAPSSLTSKLVHDELRGALTYHLVHCAFSPPFFRTRVEFVRWHVLTRSSSRSPVSHRFLAPL